MSTVIRGASLALCAALCVATILGVRPATAQTGEFVPNAEGRVVMEAEHFLEAVPGDFVNPTSGAINEFVVEDVAGASNGQAIISLPNEGGDSNAEFEQALENNGPFVVYSIEIPEGGAGLYEVWLRANGQSNTDDSFWVVLHNFWETAHKVVPIQGSWEWTNQAEGGFEILFELAEGENLVSIWMREDGTYIDKLLLQPADSELGAPIGFGPAESGSTVAAFESDRRLGLTPLTVTFDPSDSQAAGDGTIQTYEWDLDGDGQVDETTNAADPVSWTYDEEGDYTVTLTVTDDAGTSKSLTSVVAAWDGAPVSGGQALFATGGLSGGDPQVVELLESIGFDVMIHAASDSLPDEAANMDVVVVSSTAMSGDVSGPEYAGLPVGMVVWEPLAYDANGLGFTDVTDGSSGFLPNTIEETTNVTIPEGQDHPIVAGFSGDVQMYRDKMEGAYGRPAESADVLATLTDTDYPVIFAYDTGDEMFGLTAPARRVGFFSNNAGISSATHLGMEILANAVIWAANMTATSAAEARDVPSALAIESVYPNPFNPRTTAVVEAGDVGAYKVRVFNVLGRLVHERNLAVQRPGRVQVDVDLGTSPSGIYLVQVEHEASGSKATARVTLLK